MPCASTITGGGPLLLLLLLFGRYSQASSSSPWLGMLITRRVNCGVSCGPVPSTWLRSHVKLLSTVSHGSAAACGAATQRQQEKAGAGDAHAPVACCCCRAPASTAAAAASTASLEAQTTPTACLAEPAMAAGARPLRGGRAGATMSGSCRRVWCAWCG